MSHLQSTPTCQSKSSRPLIPSPPGHRRLGFGSSQKANIGYGIVSASGFSAWKRGVKRGSTSTHTNANPNKENSTVTTSTASGSNAFNRELIRNGKKKGLGMGYEGTPARKRYKRESKISKASMGTHSTPKGSISRAPTADQSPSTSLSVTISSLNSDSQSQIESASSIAPIDDTFAVGAETIIGEDLFGLTISIDADGTTHPLSPDRSSTTPPDGGGYTTGWFDPEAEYMSYMEEREEFDRLVEFAEMDVPVDFGDEEEDGGGGDDTIQAFPQEVIEDWSDEDDGDVTIQAGPDEAIEDWSDDFDPARIWDITVPIRETSVLSNTVNLEEGPSGEVDSECGTGVDVHEGRRSLVVDHRVNTPVGQDRGESRRSRSQRISGGDDTIRTSADLDPVESNRGLNISKIGLTDHSETVAEKTTSPPGPDAEETPSLDHHSQDDIISPLPRPIIMDQVEEVDFTSRIPNPGSLAAEEIPRFSSASSVVTPNKSFEGEGDSLGFAVAERYIRREKPRWYRATSSPTPPPPGRELSRLTYSPTPVPSIVPSPSPILHEDRAAPEGKDQPVWKGAWKGRETQKNRRKQKRESDAGNDSIESEGQGRRCVEKVFHEPVYLGEAKRARDARIAHCKDLETNYKLAVEQVYF